MWLTYTIMVSNDNFFLAVQTIWITSLQKCEIFNFRAKSMSRVTEINKILCILQCMIKSPKSHAWPAKALIRLPISEPSLVKWITLIQNICWESEDSDQGQDSHIHAKLSLDTFTGRFFLLCWLVWWSKNHHQTCSMTLLNGQIYKMD